MAYYTSRVDDDGKEIERRHSARSLTISISGSTRKSLSSRSNQDIKSSVRYVNPAAYIEKTTPDPSEVSSLSVSNSEHNGNAMSNDEQSNIVPLLDLISEENYPTTRDCTFSYRKHCDVAKIEIKPELAYQTWLSAKRKILSDEAVRRRKADELKEMEQLERKKLAKENYKNWLRTKQITMRTQEKLHNSSPTEQTTKPIVHKPTRLMDEKEAQAKMEEWERNKMLEEDRRRLLKREEEELRRAMEGRRRELANEAWEKWIAEVDKKPKPVPLNRGIFTLRGTVSDLYVNPNEWQSVIPVESDN